MVIRATAIVRTNSVQSKSAASAIGVPSTFTNWLIGTDSGCGSRFAKLAMRPARSLRVSFMPTIPPQQTFKPTRRTFPNVLKRSSKRRVPMTLW